MVKVSIIGKGNFGTKIENCIKDNVTFVNPNDADWYVSAYVRNLSDSDHIYAKYNSDPTIGGFANGVALDPKIWGINFGMNF